MYFLDNVFWLEKTKDSIFFRIWKVLYLKIKIELATRTHSERKKYLPVFFERGIFLFGVGEIFRSPTLAKNWQGVGDLPHPKKNPMLCDIIS